MKTAFYARLSTERENPRSASLDRLSALQIVRLMNREDRRTLRAIARAEADLACAAERIVRSLSVGGSLFFVGAGTSGRLGVIEAAECPPTFNVPARRVRALMAGGRKAVFRSQEGSEDSLAEGRRAVRKWVRRGDVVLGIAASGVTPFVRAALRQARRQKASVLLLTCSPAPGLKKEADILIVLDTGPEVLTGSTRLKAGTACKMALNILTTASMAQLGKMYGHWMVDLQPKSRKLVARGLRIIQDLGRVSEKRARRLFARSHGEVKTAIVMARRKYSYTQATRRLSQANGFLRRAL